MSTYRNKVQPKSKVILGGSFKKSRNIKRFTKGKERVRHYKWKINGFLSKVFEIKTKNRTIVFHHSLA